jgi:hypothetical protein
MVLSGLPGLGEGWAASSHHDHRCAPGGNLLRFGAFLAVRTIAPACHVHRGDALVPALKGIASAANTLVLIGGAPVTGR